MEENSLKTVERALDVLECFITETEELSFTDLRESTGISKAAMFRILQTLEKREYICKVESNGKYRLGTSSLIIGYAAKNHSTIVQRTKKALIDLHDKFDQNTNIYLLSQNRRMCVNQRLSSIINKTSIKVGGLYPLHWGAAGHAILAYIDYNELLKIYEFLENKSPGYIKRHNLNDKLNEIRNTGVSVQLGNKLDDIVCTAAPFFGKDGKILGCVSVSGMKYLYPEDVDTVVKIVKFYAEDISAQYGNVVLERYNE